MKLLFAALISVSLFVSCHPDNTDPNPTPAPTPTPPDTLATGWTRMAPITGDFIQDIVFINNTGFLLTFDSLYKSIDGGRTWQGKYHFPGILLSEMAMGNEQNLCLGGSGDTVYTSKDGGTSFSRMVLNSNVPPVGVCYSAPGIVYVGGKEIRRSQNAGDTWQTVATVPSSTTFHANVWFLDATRGWHVSTAGLYQTTNSGDTWTKNTAYTFGVHNGVGIVQFTDVNTGYISTLTGMFKTTNGGASWTQLTSVNSILPEFADVQYPDIHFINSSTGYYVSGRKIYRTTDGGNTWTVVVAMGNRKLCEIHFTDATHGWACGEYGTLLRFEL